MDARRYMTNAVIANMSRQASVPQGWAAERSSVYQAGRNVSWLQRDPTLYWRGGDTHSERKRYANALNAGRIRLPGIKQDALLCENHCSSDQGSPPSAWCNNRMLLSLPGHSFAVGFKYTMLCGSLVVRGAKRACNSSRCADEEFEQWWQATIPHAQLPNQIPALLTFDFAVSAGGPKPTKR